MDSMPIAVIGRDMILFKQTLRQFKDEIKMQEHFRIEAELTLNKRMTALEMKMNELIERLDESKSCG